MHFHGHHVSQGCENLASFTVGLSFSGAPYQIPGISFSLPLDPTKSIALSLGKYMHFLFITGNRFFHTLFSINPAPSAMKQLVSTASPSIGEILHGQNWQWAQSIPGHHRLSLFFFTIQPWLVNEHLSIYCWPLVSVESCDKAVFTVSSGCFLGTGFTYLLILPYQRFDRILSEVLDTHFPGCTSYRERMYLNGHWWLVDRLRILIKLIIFEYYDKNLLTALNNKMILFFPLRTVCK